MSVTANDIFTICMAQADEMTDSINVINANDTASYKARTPSILTALQAELIKVGRIFKTIEHSNKPIPNMLGIGNGFDYISFTGNEIIKEANGSVKSYYFETDGEGTIYIEDYNGSWNTLATINAIDAPVRNFQSYKGTVTPTAGATASRIRFTGAYEYTITNYAMFSIPFKPSRIPVYRPWIKIEMPVDFVSADQIVNEYPRRRYEKSTGYKWENNNELWADYFYEGNIRINYRPVPSIISAMGDMVQVDDVTARTTMVYGLGAELFKEENPAIYKHFSVRFKELKALAMVKQPASEQAILNIYGW